jgi:glycosyltransferase involved in cell wall biosynthesis
MLLNDYPEVKLYMIFSEEKLKQQVLKFINHYSSLQDSVTLIGFVDHQHLKDYYNSSDYFILGSHYEGSGYSVVEAMSCGVVPIVTDIPSFRMITNNGKVGALWKAGDSKSLYTNVKTILGKDLNTESMNALNQFNNNLSYSAIGEKAKIFYNSLLSS